MKNGPLFTMLGAAFALGVICGMGELPNPSAFQTPKGDAPTVPVFAGDSVRVWTDPASGCQYLARGNQGITQRLDNQGRHMCAGYLTPKPAKGLL